MGLETIHTPVARVLAWIGSQGTRAIAALVVLGIASPQMGAVLRPYVTEAIFVVLCIAFMRLQPTALRSHFARPMLPLAAVVWTMLLIPALMVGVLALVGDAVPRELRIALIINAVTAPMMAVPGFVTLVGLDGALALIVLVGGSLMLPLTAPLFVAASLGPEVAVDPIDLSGRLFAILAGSALAGTLLRHRLGASWISRRGAEINGLNILALYVFVAAVMGNVEGAFATTPLLAAGVGLLALGVFLCLIGVSFAAFAWAGRDHAWLIAFVTAQKNMGVMLAAYPGGLPELAWLYVALGQLPLYLSPEVLRSWTARKSARRAPVAPCDKK